MAGRSRKQIIAGLEKTVKKYEKEGLIKKQKPKPKVKKKPSLLERAEERITAPYKKLRKYQKSQAKKAYKTLKLKSELTGKTPAELLGAKPLKKKRKKK